MNIQKDTALDWTVYQNTVLICYRFLKDIKPFGYYPENDMDIVDKIKIDVAFQYAEIIKMDGTIEEIITQMNTVFITGSKKKKKSNEKNGFISFLK